MPVNHPIVNSSAHMLGTSTNQEIFSILLNTSPIFLALICLSFLFILYKNINKFFLTKALSEEQIKKEINYQTIAYAVFISSVAGFMADMYLSTPISIFIACCVLYVIYLLVRFLAPQE
jgi:hypothetical protein